MALSPGVASKYDEVPNSAEPLASAARVVRCECMRCGSHVRATAHRQTLSGMCGTCGSYELAPLEKDTMAA